METLIAERCNCMCHHFPGVKHIKPCCDRTYELYESEDIDDIYGTFEEGDRTFPDRDSRL